MAGPRSSNSLMWERDRYEMIDAGVRFAVKVLHAAGIETCQSCEGGDGHAYDRPSVDLPDRGFVALVALHEYGLPVADLAWLWEIRDGLPFQQPIWRVTFRNACPERADEWPMFEWSYECPEARDD